MLEPKELTQALSAGALTRRELSKTLAAVGSDWPSHR